jgi:hypothetical protein
MTDLAQVKLQGDLRHLDVQVRMIRDRTRGKSQDISDLAEYIHRLIEVVEGLAPNPAS